jgi:hypothetical protein
MERWEQMTPEQREEFRKGFRRFGSRGQPNPASETGDHPTP